MIISFLCEANEMLNECLKYSIKKYFTYFSYYINDLLGTLIFPVLFNGLFWNETLKLNKLQYELKDLIVYLVISNIMYFITSVEISSVISADIKTQKLGKKLLYPLNYVTKFILETGFNILIRIVVIFMPIYVLLYFITKLNVNLHSIVIGLLFAIAAIVINFLLTFIIGFCAFYFTEIWGLEAIKNLVFYALSGTFFPYDILSNKIQQIIYATPFPYLSYFPTKAIMDQEFVLKVEYFQVAILWIALLSLLAIFIWKKGIKKYESCGV